MHMKSVKAVLDRLASVLGTTSGNQLAEALGVSPQAVSSWKSRESVPYAQCVEVAEQRGISLDWLLTGIGSKSRDMATPNLAMEESAASYGTNPKERAILELFRELDEGGQREIQSAAEEKKRLKTLEQRVQELETVVADIKRLA
jgi:transcriptional regulator with XRE-family HTH domain